MTNKEIKIDKKETALGCAVIIACGVVALSLGATLGILFYKYIWL